MKKPVEPSTIGKIKVADALKNVKVLLHQDKSISPQVRAMRSYCSLSCDPFAPEPGTPQCQPAFRRRKILPQTRIRNFKKRKPGGQNGHDPID